MAKGIEGWDDDAAAAMLTEISDEIVEAAKGLCYFHRWEPTDMVKSNLAGIALFAMASPSTSQVGHCVRRHTVQAN